MTRPGRLRWGWSVAGALAVGAAVGLWVTRPPPPRPLAPGPRIDPGAVVVRGVYHVHTRRSDGSGTVEEVAAAAARAGLRFVVFTDHGDATAAPMPPAYRSGVLCIDGVEISTTEGHYVALGLGATPWRLAGDARDVVADVARFGGFGIAAHPDSPKPALAWRAWSEPIDGLEWLNLDTEWRDESTARLLLSLLHYPWRPLATVGALIGDAGGLLARWAALARERRVVGLGGVDAHARFGAEGGFGDGRPGITAPGYEVTFGALQLAVELDAPLSGGATTDAAAVLAALRAARVSSVIAARATPGHVRFEAERGQARVRMGGTLPSGEAPIVLRAAADAPEGSAIRLTCDGRLVAEGPASAPLVHALAADTQSTSCQMLVGFPQGGRFLHWVVSNPIWTRPLPSPAASAAGPAARTQAVDLASAAAWTVERDRASRASQARLEGEPGLLLQFALADGERRSQYAAFVLTAVTGLSQAAGVQVTLSSDRRMRVSVQLREPGGTGEGRRWQRSVVVLPEATTHAIRFDDMRPVAPASGRPALDRVHALLFVVDTVHTPPGRVGTIRLHDVGWLVP